MSIAPASVFLQPREVLRHCIGRRAHSSVWLSVFGLLLTAGCNSQPPPSPDSPPASPPAAAVDSVAEQLQAAIGLTRQGRVEEAQTLLTKVLAASPDNLQALALAANLHAAQGDFCRAARAMDRVAEGTPAEAVQAHLMASQWFLRCGDLLAVENSLRKALQRAPNDPRLHRGLLNLLNAEGRRFEARHHALALLKIGDYSHRELVSLVDLNTPFAMGTLAQQNGLVDQSLFAMGTARERAFQDDQPQVALPIQAKVAAEFPQLAAAHALWGRLLAITEDDEGLRKWQTSLPADASKHPDYWATLGMWLRNQGEESAAIGAFTEAITRDPTDRSSLRDMVTLLDSQGQTQIALRLSQQLESLDRIFRTAANADVEQARWIATELERLGRRWEALAWERHAAELQGTLDLQLVELARKREQLRSMHTDAPEAYQAAWLDALGFDRSDYPPPEIPKRLVGGNTPATDTRGDAARLRFRDIASEVGIKTSLQSGYDLQTGRFLLHQANGGGLVATDFDLDGRPDVYVMQAGGEPNNATDSAPNELYRQTPDGMFESIGLQAGVADRGYGQGICVGDINQDGWPDFWVANVGTNVCLINQGDGTFRPQPLGLPIERDNWTSSVAIADVTGDALPDVVEVNYVDDPRAYQVYCQGKSVACVPYEFKPANDRLLINLGDGQFELSESFAAGREGAAYGFGVIITNLDRQAGNDIFIGNDGMNNHYWISQPSAQQPQRYSLTESAGLTGCAISGAGNIQACMGVTASDFDRNGEIDFHVTNFFDEPSNLYLQSPSGLFADESRRYQLHPITMPNLGFGTQAADWDNDGWQDLAILNGHLYDARYAGVPFRMPANLLRGSKQGFSDAAKDEQTGSYWQTPRLGRTLAVLDWNRDGRMDLLANHLDAPIAFLENRSDAGHWLQFELVGTHSERDAIGAVVTVTAGEQTWTAWQIGGDGLMSTNEPIVQIGLGAETEVNSVVVAWPSGRQQVLENIRADQRYLLIEDQPPWPR